MEHTRKVGGCGACELDAQMLEWRLQAWIDDLALVLELLEIYLMEGGWIKVDKPPWLSAAWRRWQNDQDFERRVRERENSDEAVCGGSGTVVFRGF